jgi:hypothetical protein
MVVDVVDVMLLSPSLSPQRTKRFRGVVECRLHMAASAPRTVGWTDADMVLDRKKPGFFVAKTINPEIEPVENDIARLYCS